jgi:hypothetical protein
MVGEDAMASVFADGTRPVSFPRSICLPIFMAGQGWMAAGCGGRG